MTAKAHRAWSYFARALVFATVATLETCRQCGGRVKVIASIEDPAVIKRILDHLDQRARQQPLAFGPLGRAPPQWELPGFED